MRRIEPALKSYAWGKPTATSFAARFTANPAPYERVAEAWFGSHPSGPAHADGQPLSDVPYLLKAISVDKALSIQVHPDARSATRLHAQRPHVYPDCVAKAEMAVAVTPFRALCGFLPDEVVQRNLHAYPEFAALAGGENTDTGLVIRRVLGATTCDAAEQVDTLRGRLDPTADDPVAELIHQLIQTYPGDVGVFAPLFMNTVDLAPGEALVIPPNEIHAYVSGDAVECMAPSDNVVRAGLTPKYRDTETLLSLITPGHRPPIVLPPGEVYSHPVTDQYFVLRRRLRPCTGPVIALVLAGTGCIGPVATSAGDAWLVGDDMGPVSPDLNFLAAEPPPKLVSMGGL